MGARKQADLTDDERLFSEALYDLQIETWADISYEAREEAARACYPASTLAQLEQLPQDLHAGMQGTILVGGETPRYLRVRGWPELYDRPQLSIFQTPAEIHKVLAKCNDLIKAGNHFRIHRDKEHIWKILGSSARRSLCDLLEQRSSSAASSPEW